MQGLHLTADLSGCDPAQRLMRDRAALAAECRAAVLASGLAPVAELFHAFSPQGSGITGVVLLAESHLAVHTWPEIGAVTLDVYVCNLASDNRHKAHALLDRLQAAFAPRHAVHQSLERGAEGLA
ncbi:MAG: adenosylmethionine decarboxylase [Rubrivivax sp.]|nr:adenosylmethionine decarboxylase [Rubrivivax sp.]